MSNTVTRLQKVVSTRGDGRFEASLRCIYEDGSYREFVAGVSADLDEVTAMAVALEAKLWAPHTG